MKNSDTFKYKNNFLSEPCGLFLLVIGHKEGDDIGPFGGREACNHEEQRDMRVNNPKPL